MLVIVNPAVKVIKCPAASNRTDVTIISRSCQKNGIHWILQQNVSWCDKIETSIEREHKNR